MNDYRSPAPGLITLTTPAQKVMAALRAAGGRPLVVGGAIRDALHPDDLDSKDIDIEVYGLEDTVRAINELSRIGRADERGVAFGVVAAVVDGEDFDISFPRRDSPSGTGHRGFISGIDPHLDVSTAFSRRDFTINAMGWDPQSEELIDPFGGAGDLAQGVLRHTSDAFGVDPLRVLRGVQFAGRFNLSFAPETAEICRQLFDKYSELSQERVWQEWRKLARLGNHWPAALTALEASGWVDHYPQLAILRNVEQDPAWHSEGNVWVHSGLAAAEAAQAATGLSPEDREVAVLGSLVHDFGKATHTQTTENGRITSHGHAEAGVKPAAEFLRGIGAPEAVILKVLPIVREHMSHVGGENETPKAAVVRRLIRRLNPTGSGPSLYDWARVVHADSAGREASAKPSPAIAWIAVAEGLGDATQPARGVLTGNTLIRLGLTPGPAFTAILAASVSAQDDGLFDDEAGALAHYLATKK